jgi:hypothetical protein
MVPFCESAAGFSDDASYQAEGYPAFDLMESFAARFAILVSSEGNTEKLATSTKVVTEYTENAFK